MSNAKKNVRFAEGLREQQLKMAPDQINMAAEVREPAELAQAAPRQPGVMDEQFPTDALTSYNKRDRVQEAKLALGELSDQTGYTPFGKLEATDADFKWYQKKQAAAEMANFQQWFAKEFDHMSPAEKKRAKELYPEFYAQRKKLLKKQAKNLYDIARIKLDGIESYKDLIKTYMLETGRLDLGPLEAIMNPEKINEVNASRDNQMRFQRGLANPFLVFGKEALPYGVATRREQQEDFAARRYPATTAQMGVEGVGFPPFAGDDAGQGDLAWFQVMSRGIQNL